MNVMDVARDIGLVVAGGDVSGTVDQDKVLRALASLSAADPANSDLFDTVVEHVQRARSAGVEVDPSFGTRAGPSDTTTQLRYRSEMSELFTDLAIDVGLRQPRNLVAVA